MFVYLKALFCEIFTTHFSMQKIVYVAISKHSLVCKSYCFRWSCPLRSRVPWRCGRGTC